ncbi:DUF6434 domain-containing protein [Erysipelothrix urinaevulpis]|uniref:DUF6434 domain-containing protein n=1 Tax=Erysipelothrix urinaevulpis TaxID=2683717 RepID=UPI00135A80AE|nr:DUF6434 domain-containing protein [Erysipelothrix urinaevulpis]
MEGRPDLKIGLNAEEFRKYYYLKKELVSFCKDNGLSTSGGKLEITDRIYNYLDSGIKRNHQSHLKTKTFVPDNLDLTTKIEDNIKCSEFHRAFFKKHLGETFSFNVVFQKWLKENSGRTYAEACEAYKRIKEEKKVTKTKIDRQFEYNTYIRDFFENNKGKTLQEAIQCWKYKKGLSGHNKYEKDDLIVLE